MVGVVARRRLPLLALVVFGALAALPNAAGAASGHGFVNMRDRLGAIGGQLSVESTPGHGTRVSARIPTPPLRVAVPHGEIISS